MSKINDGGQAFPHSTLQTYRDGGFLESKHDGMTIRDYFAAKAMQAMITSNASPHSPGYALKYNKVIPGEAYKYADLMLKAREATEEKEPDNAKVEG